MIPEVWKPLCLLSIWLNIVEPSTSNVTWPATFANPLSCLSLFYGTLTPWKKFTTKLDNANTTQPRKWLDLQRLWIPLVSLNPWKTGVNIPINITNWEPELLRNQEFVLLFHLESWSMLIYNIVELVRIRLVLFFILQNSSEFVRIHLI